jgi:nucleotide-binding universal stress UspA family protein
MKALVPVDGSENALRALRHAIDMAKQGALDEIHVLNVQPPLGGDVSTFVGSATVKDYHREEAEKVLASAKKLLDEAKINYKPHITVGSPGECVAELAKRHKVDKVIMGTRGLGKVAGLLLGSVASDVIKRSPVPVTLVK